MHVKERANTTPTESVRAAQRVWTEKPVGYQRSSAEPGSREFFEEVRRYRYGYETPWIPSYFRFDSLRGKRVLEIGVGLGIDAAEMIRAGAHYVGIDITARHLQLAARNVALNCDPEVPPSFVEGDLLSVPLDGQFDVIYTFGVLHHIANEFEYLCKMREMLAPGGVLRFAVYSKYSFFNAYLYWTWIIRNRRRNSFSAWQSHVAELTDISDPVTIRVRSRRSIEAMLARAGFAVLRYRRQGFVQRYIPVVGKWLAPEGSTLSGIGRLLGWYHCYECVSAS